MRVLTKILLLLGSILVTPGYAADQIQVVVAGNNRAVILFNNERIVLRPDHSVHERVTLISANTDQVVLSVDGKETILNTDTAAAPILPEPEQVEENEPYDSGVVTLWANSSGFFFANGTINRRPLRFLVDTGANTITLSGAQADQLGIQYQNAKDGFASTASGITRMKSLTLKRVSLEGITLQNVAANIIPGPFPDVPLLGASFLNKLNMVRSGNRMELTRR